MYKTNEIVQKRRFTVLLYNQLGVGSTGRHVEHPFIACLRLLNAFLVPIKVYRDRGNSRLLFVKLGSTLSPPVLPHDESDSAVGTQHRMKTTRRLHRLIGRATNTVRRDN